MPPRATLSKLKKQMESTAKSSNPGGDDLEFSQSEKFSAMEKRLVAMELRIEEMTKAAAIPPVPQEPVTQPTVPTVMIEQSALPQPVIYGMGAADFLVRLWFAPVAFFCSLQHAMNPDRKNLG
ncbi:MAG: hypothetical protein HQL07_03360 [Nitrospirae bacterium]|nr:hypothetical protein [Magnetococcales bacterium]HAT49980.1 hypothetical protein [Alphaproteobacteria bacterium]